MLPKWNRKAWGVVALGLLLFGGAWVLNSQEKRNREKRAAKPGTLRALVESSSSQGELQLAVNDEFPVYPSVDGLASASEVVALGKVVGLRAIPCDRDQFVCTQFRFRVDEVIQGSISLDRRGGDRIPETPAVSEETPEFFGPGPNEIVVTQSGGHLALGGRKIRATVSGERLLRNGRDYILFLTWIPAERLTTAGSNTYHLTAGVQAAVEIVDDQLASMVSDGNDHPVSREIQHSFGRSKSNLISHLKKTKKQRPPSR